MRVKLELFDKLSIAAYAALAVAAFFRMRAALPLCFFRALTGLPCPGCGMGHSLTYAFQGRWRDCFHSHPLGLPLLAVWTAYLLLGVANLSRGRSFRAGAPRLPNLAGWGLIALVLAVYALRLRSGS